MKRPKPKVRVSLDLNVDLKERLDRLSQNLGIPQAEVLRRGIVLIELAVEAKAKGQHFGLVTDHSSLSVRIIGVI